MKKSITTAQIEQAINIAVRNALKEVFDNLEKDGNGAITIKEVRAKGRPRTSCFGPNSQELREKRSQLVRQFVLMHYVKDKGAIYCDGVYMRIDCFGALLSKAMIPYENNQTDFVAFLKETGVSVNYRNFLRLLKKYKKRVPEKYKKIGNYLVDFFELDASKKLS